MIVTCLELSTAHLTRSTMRLLTEFSDEQRMGNGWPAMTVANYKHGAFVTVPEKSDLTIEHLDNLPSDLECVLGHARNYGATLVRFDSDGADCPDLETYIW